MSTQVKIELSSIVTTNDEPAVVLITANGAQVAGLGTGVSLDPITNRLVANVTYTPPSHEHVQLVPVTGNPQAFQIARALTKPITKVGVYRNGVRMLQDVDYTLNNGLILFIGGPGGQNILPSDIVSADYEF
jgi:hypothetical protein